MAYQSSSWPSKFLVIRSLDAATYRSVKTGLAEMTYTLATPIIRPTGARMLLSVQGVVFTKSVRNISEWNNALVLDLSGGGELTVTVPVGSYSVDEFVKHANLACGPYVNMIISPITGRVELNGISPFSISPDSTIAQMLGFVDGQLGKPALSHAGRYTHELMSPVRGFLVRSNLTCNTETSNGQRNANVLCRVPISFENETLRYSSESWVPIHPHECLLHEHTITTLELNLIDADSHEPVYFADRRGWSIEILIKFVADPMCAKVTKGENYPSAEIKDARKKTKTARKAHRDRGENRE